MNKLELLTEERADIEKAHVCVTEAISRLNFIRDKLFYAPLEKEAERLQKHMDYLDEEIEKTKKSISGLVVSSNQPGHILVAKNLDAQDVFLRIRFLQESVKGDDWNDAMLLDWVSDFDKSCFIQFESFTSGNKVFDKDKFKEVYKFHKKKGLESTVDPGTIKLKSVEREVKQSYRFDQTL